MRDRSQDAALVTAASAGCSLEASIRAPQSLGPVTMVLRYVAYPLLLVAAVVTTAMAIRLGLPLLLVNFLFFIGTFCYLALLERLIPYEPRWHPEGWEWKRDGLCYFITTGSAGSARAAVVSASLLVAPLQTNLPLGATIPAAIAVLSSCSYLYHRLSHRIPWLWRAHGIHHVPAKVNVANNSLNHFADVFGHSFFTQLPLLLLGLPQPAIFAATMLRAAQGYGIHANIDVKLGWLNYVMITPEQHRLHHSSDPREAGHYATDLTLWDLLFGTFTWRPKRAPVTVGVQDPSSFPPSDAILASQAHPFRHPHRYDAVRHHTPGKNITLKTET